MQLAKGIAACLSLAQYLLASLTLASLKRPHRWWVDNPALEGLLRGGRLRVAPL